MRHKDFVSRYLSEVTPTAFELEAGEEFHVIGAGPAQFRVTLHKPLSRRELLRSTSLALGEAYMRGDLEVDRDLYEVLDQFLGDMERFRTDRRALRSLLHTSLSPKNQRQEVTSHYDIGNDFYQLWLDETMSYSCGYFPREDTTLFEAQVGKVDHILRKLALKPGMTILDIGCGWGFLIKRAVLHYGVHAVGITLSQEQHRKVTQEIQEEHLEGRMAVKLMDYRELKTCGMEFDRVVSVGMIEHVGRGNYGAFLDCVSSVLKPGGLFLLHFISGQEEHEGDPWIRKYIFPGGVIPSLREIMDLLPRRRFRTLDVESLRRHYTRTLLCWKENFQKHRATIRQRYGDEFARMWELYLASCAAAFHNGVVDLHQLLLSKGVNNDLPMTRVV